MLIGLKQWIWEDTIVTMVLLGRFSYPWVRQYLLYEIRYFGRIPTIICVCTCNHTLNKYCRTHGYEKRPNNTVVPMGYSLIHCFNPINLYPSIIYNRIIKI